ncbi:MAG: nucleotidyltransferase domain-containing protein [Desulfobacterales bacterium]|nr:nucleotidyltransferase domain-containing protein [Desulfobacterales bacterium]MBF0395257.1 nucleotidyltransferase domain-containing protein [Desulfobacterales bacterium]
MNTDHNNIKPNFDYYKKDLRKICKDFNVRRLSCFGSVNTDKFKQDSDIDLLVTFGDSEGNDIFERYFGLKERLEELFKRNVEIVFDKKFKNPFFRESVNKTKRVIYER